jgi:hypothetical protein
MRLGLYTIVFDPIPTIAIHSSAKHIVFRTRFAGAILQAVIQARIRFCLPQLLRSHPQYLYQKYCEIFHIVYPRPGGVFQ